MASVPIFGTDAFLNTQSMDLLVEGFKRAITDPDVKAFFKALITEAVQETKGVSQNQYLNRTQAASFIGKGTSWITAKLESGKLDNYGSLGKALFCPTQLKEVLQEENEATGKGRRKPIGSSTLQQMRKVV